ncbi:MAG: PorP/SprF family type IX secretion system membrane protein [Chitinophagales bacterium]
MKNIQTSISVLKPLQLVGSMFCLLVLLSVSYSASAQQTPLFSAYHFNRFLINPGFTGIDNEYRGFGFYRTQWVNMPGQPITGGATVEGSFWKDRIGAGIFVLNDKIGIFNRTNVAASYAQKIKFAKDHQIAIGVQGGAFINQINFGAANAKDYNDPTIALSKPTKIVFDLNIGLSYKWKGLLVGFAVPHVLQPDAKYPANGNDARYQYVRQYNAFAQYRISLLKGNFNITPTVMMRKAAASGYQFDGTLLLDYKNLAFIGAGYRNSFGVIAMAGVNILNMFTVAYAFDYTTQRVLNGQVGATHEITAGFHIPSDFKRKKKEDTQDLVNAQLAEDLSRRNDTLLVKLRMANAKAETAKKELAATNKENDSLRREVQTLQQIAGGLFPDNRPIDNMSSLELNEKVYSLDKIYFAPNEFVLLPESREQLDSLTNFLARFPATEISISGYTDNTGGDELNLKLSESRAKSVAEYLISKGIAKNRLSYKGFGSANPRASNSTQKGRRLNRRVEFTITKE